MTGMDIATHARLRPRDTLGLEVRNDVAYGGMRWITVGPADRPGTSMSGLPVRR